MSDSYQSALHRAWVGERQGEVFFAKVAELTAEPEMKRKWTVLAELERRVGIVLADIVETSEGEVIDTQSAEQAAIEFAAAPLPQAMASIVGVIDGAVDRYNALLDDGPEEHARELEILAEHEVALQTFVRRELADQPADSLEEVDELLKELRD